MIYDLFFDEVDILARLVHKILFAREALEAVALVEIVDFLLRIFGIGTIAVALFFEPLDLPAAMPEMDHALLAYEEIDDRKDHQHQDIFAPFAPRKTLPEFRKIYLI